MPNWCHNTVTITGPDDAVAEVVEFIGDGKDLFNKVLPMPKILEDSVSPPRDEEVAAAAVEACGYPDWYSWACATWGTKWDADVSLDLVSPGHVEFSMGTAWSPPIPVIAQIAERFSRVHIEHFFNETGSDFSGTDTYDNGSLTDREQGPGLVECVVCSGLDTHDAMLRDGDYDYFHAHCLASTAEVLVSCKNPTVLDQLAAAVTGHDLREWLPADHDDAVMTLVLARVPDPGEAEDLEWYGLDVVDLDLPVTVTVTSGGSLMLTYPTLLFDIGGSLVGLSAQFPTVTFYLSVTQTGFDHGVRRGVVASGQLYSATNQPS